MKTRNPGYFTLLALTITWTLGALLTLVPAPTAYRVSLLGYAAHCPFAPVSTVLCAAAAALTCTVRRRLFTETVQVEEVLS